MEWRGKMYWFYWDTENKCIGYSGTQRINGETGKDWDRKKQSTGYSRKETGYSGGDRTNGLVIVEKTREMECYSRMEKEGGYSGMERINGLVKLGQREGLDSKGTVYIKTGRRTG